MDFNLILRDLVTLWVVIDPIGSIPVFLMATAGLDAGVRRSIAIRGVLVAAAILLFFLVVGQMLLDAMEISLTSFQISGGIILLLFALKMIFATPKQSTSEAIEDPMQTAVFPIAIPSIAGPGAILSVVLLTDNQQFDLSDQIMTAGLLGIVLLVVLFLLLLASPIHRIIGTGGENIISRVMGMILAALAVNTILSAFVDIGWISAQSLAAGG